MCVLWRSSMCCCFLPQMFSFVFNGQSHRHVWPHPQTDLFCIWRTQGWLEITEIQMLPSQTNKELSQHTPMEFDAGPSSSYRNKTNKTTNYYFLWNVCVFKFKEHPSSLQTTNVSGHTKLFLINTWFCYLMCSDWVNSIAFPSPS